MRTITETIEIHAPIGHVWARLADVGNIADWNPGLKGSHATSDASGLGATRYCDIDGEQNLDEEVVAFEPERAITFRITRSTLPFRSADIRFWLDDHGEQTQVTVSPKYQLKYGPLGWMLDAAFVSKAYRKGVRGLLEGLKKHVEGSS